MDDIGAHDIRLNAEWTKINGDTETRWTDSDGVLQDDNKWDSFKVNIFCGEKACLTSALIPASPPQDVSIGVGQGPESTQADEFQDQYSVDCGLKCVDVFPDQLSIDSCSIDCGDKEYKLVYAEDESPVSEELATLSIDSSNNIEIIAGTDLYSYSGTHEVKIEGTSKFTTNSSTVAAPAFKINVDGCFPFSCG